MYIQRCQIFNEMLLCGIRWVSRCEITLHRGLFRESPSSVWEDGFMEPPHVKTTPNIKPTSRGGGA